VPGLDEDEDEEDLDLAAVFVASADVLAWLLVGATAAVAVFRDGREGRLFWAWCAALALAALLASAVALAGAVGADSGATRVGFTVAGVWTAAAGVVAALFLPWRRIASRAAA
jgi:hypothetical protein